MLDYASLLSEAGAELESRRNEIERLRSRLSGQLLEADVVICSAALRLPGGVATTKDFWSALVSGKEFHEALEGCREGDLGTQEEWLQAAKITANMTRVVEPYDFDNIAFGISPREAKRMDPQHRLMMEVALEALEAAACDGKDYNDGRGGVYIGLSSDDYHSRAYHPDYRSSFDPYSGIGTSRSMVAGRISANFGWTGPAIQVDTACSSSLVALHMACQAIRGGEVDYALVGACHLVLNSQSVLARGALGALAKDGKCKAFEQGADGFGLGEGCVSVFLCSRKFALASGLPILGAVAGSAVNHNGAGAGITVPNPKAQEEVMRTALHQSCMAVDDIQYVEAHGTGTDLGDPIEYEALKNVYGAREESLYIGSVKRNLGHLEAAAGLVSLVKALMVLREKELPPTPSLASNSEKIDWGGSKIQVLRKSKRLKGQVNGVAVSSFGMSGTNAHVILKPLQANENNVEAVDTESYPVLVSADGGKSLRSLCMDLADAAKEASSLASFCRTLAMGRRHRSYRIGFVAKSLSEVAEVLQAYSVGEDVGVGLSVSDFHRGRFTPVILHSRNSQGEGEIAQSLLAQIFNRIEVAETSCLSFWSSLFQDFKILEAGDFSEAVDKHFDEGESRTRLLSFEVLSPASPSSAREPSRLVSNILVESFCANARVNWGNLKYLSGPRMKLPTYSFNRKELFISPDIIPK